MERPKTWEDFYRKWKKSELHMMIVGIVGTLSILILFPGWLKLYASLPLLLLLSGIINYKDTCKEELKKLKDKTQPKKERKR